MTGYEWVAALPALRGVVTRQVRTCACLSCGKNCESRLRERERERERESRTNLYSVDVRIELTDVIPATKHINVRIDHFHCCTGERWWLHRVRNGATVNFMGELRKRGGGGGHHTEGYSFIRRHSFLLRSRSHTSS